MRVLLTNLFIDRNSGTETFVETVADGLRRAGHCPMIYATRLGPQAERMSIRGHVVVDSIGALPAEPDVIHAQHAPTTIIAIAAFPHTPVLNYCHSARFAAETPVLHPNVRRHVAIDELCRARCLTDGDPRERLSVLLNPVDLERFSMRGALPNRPKRALILGKRREHRPLVEEACAASGVVLDELGDGVRFSTSLEEDLPAYDLVFGGAEARLKRLPVAAASSSVTVEASQVC